MTGFDLEGSPIEIKDEKALALQQLACQAAVGGGDCAAFITELFGPEVGSTKRFTGEVGRSLAVLRGQGVRSALALAGSTS